MAVQGQDGDETLTCRVCNREFSFTVGEQEFYKKQGYANKPRRCKNCNADAGGGGGERGRGKSSVEQKGNGGGGRHMSVQLNMQIQDSSSTEELCELIESHAEEFSPINVSSAFRKLLQSRRDGVPRGLAERATQALEAAALRRMDNFKAQQVANILHIMAKTRYRPSDPALVPKLDGRAEALAGTFKAQDVANTLWAYATDRKSVV